MAKKKKFYVVWNGLTPGIYLSWDACQAQIKGVKGAVYKSFASKEEAERAYASPAYEYVKRTHPNPPCEGGSSGLAKQKVLPHREDLGGSVACASIILKMGNLEAINVVEAKSDGTSSFMVGTTEYAVPLGSLIDVEAEVAKLQAELTYLEGFLNSVMKKLSNERFVSNAPEAVVAAERKKQADAESKIAAIKESLAKFTI